MPKGDQKCKPAAYLHNIWLTAVYNMLGLGLGDIENENTFIILLDM